MSCTGAKVVGKADELDVSEVSELDSEKVLVGLLASEDDDSLKVDVGVGVGVSDVELDELETRGGVEVSSASDELDLDVVFGVGGGGSSAFLGGFTGLSSLGGCTGPSSLGDCIGLCSSEPLSPLPLPFELRSVTTYLAEPPLGTVTTQDAAPPAPIELLPTNSLTPCWDGSIAHGRPLHPSPSHSISMLKVGFSSLNGVAGSR
ncbi:MAG: hypothetical protein Q9204_009380 [Flavoplaca sp. TL-2023a]